MTALTVLKGIGEKNSELYAKLGIDSVESAVFYFPRDHVVYEKISEPSELTVDRTVAFAATVVKRPLVKRVRRLYVASATLSAEGVHISATWFNMPYLNKSLKQGSVYVFRGVLSNEGDHYHIRQPQIFTKDQYEELLGHINPVYPLTKGLTNSAVTKTVKKAFDYLGDSCRPELFDMHFPADAETLERARKALVFDEFLVFMLKLGMLRAGKTVDTNDFGIIPVAECSRVIERLPYRLTGAQMRTWKEIEDDLSSDVSMRRLVQGDVGSGKTVIAMLAAINVAVCGHQCAIMAPTEILAGQHFESLKKLISGSDLEIKAVLLTGSMTESAKKNVRSMVESGEASIIIGTHALLYDRVVFSDLALVITDEQHRFGVGQRNVLASKNGKSSAHVLVMSATPIPRTLAIILYGDLSVSLIDEVPSHKLPIKNAVVGERYRNAAYKLMKTEIENGHQVYVICPLVEESEGLDANNVYDTAARMSEVFPPTVRIGILHGQMKGQEKQKVMEDFAGGSIDILVSTTVVEVGVNVPNATVMLIENADRFGLAALHQLRGRIGRGPSQSYCIFMCATDREESLKRLEILHDTNDGFRIAEEDLKLRGPGEMFGIRQSGDLRFRLGDLYKDASVLKEASDMAKQILDDDPDLSKPENSKYREIIDGSGDVKDVASTL